MGRRARRAQADSELSDRELVERWFVRRGVTQFSRSSTGARDAWRRALPLLVLSYFYRTFAASFGDWSNLTREFLAIPVALVVFLGGWAASNRLRGRPTFARPRMVGNVDIALFLLVPTTPAIIFGDLVDVVSALFNGAVLLALIYVWARLGIGSLIRWAVRHGGSHLTSLASLLARALPLLLVFNTFLFINAEVWEVAGTLSGVPFFLTIGTFALLGSAFALVQVSSHIEAANTFESWEQVADSLGDSPAQRLAVPTGVVHTDALTALERINLKLVILVGQAFQITLVVASVTGFFLLLGFLTVSEPTTLAWTRLDDLAVFFRADTDSHTLTFSEPLVRVAVFLGAFSGMYFTVLLTTDDTYQQEFASDLRGDVRQTLATRQAYRHALASSAR